MDINEQIENILVDELTKVIDGNILEYIKKTSPSYQKMLKRKERIDKLNEIFKGKFKLKNSNSGI